MKDIPNTMTHHSRRLRKQEATAQVVDKHI